MATMRAVIVKDGKGPVENLYIGEIAKPSPRHNEVLVKVEWISSNCFIDLNTGVNIQIKAFGINRMDIYQREGRYPLPPGAPETLGVEFSGTIVEVGEGCQPIWKLGDEVIGLASGVRR